MEHLPDVRDGLTRLQRVILLELRNALRESPQQRISSALLYGRVVEHVNVSVPAFERALRELTGGTGRASTPTRRR